jgi:hypothetical protein
VTIFVNFSGSSVVLSTYLAATQRLLHDANGNFWSAPELYDYINAGRQKVASMTGCIRYLDTSFTLTTGTEVYPFTSLTKGTVTIDVLNVTVIYGNTRYPLRWMPWTEFTAYMRPWTTYQTLPQVWTKFGSNNIYIGPKPDQAYTTEIDTILTPNTLVDDTTVEQLIYPYTEPVQYYAAYLAKQKEQSYGEANMHLGNFMRTLREAAASAQLRRIRDVYNQVGPV